MNDDASRRPFRILCVSPLFVPAAHAEAFVAAKWVRALVDSGVDVIVLSEPGLLAGPDAVDASGLWEPLKKLVVPVDAPAGASRVASLWLGLRYGALAVYPRWIDLVVRRAVELHREKPFDLVCSRSLPMRSHIAGYWCARRLRLPWVANINDPWDLHLFPGGGKKDASGLRAAVSGWWLRRTMRRADLVTGPCDRLNRYNLALAGSDRAAEVVPHVGWSAVAPAGAATAEFRLVHAGALGREPLSGGRPSKGLLEVLGRFLARRGEARGRTKLKLIGLRDPDSESVAAELGLADVVESTGRVSYERSLEEIASASACVLIEADVEEGIYLPSKLADYVSARKPVLALSPRVGTVADLAPEPGIVRCDASDVDAIERAVEGLYDDFLAGRLGARGPSETLRRRFEPASVAEAFLAAVERAGVRIRMHGS